MAAQELRWLTYLLTDLGERPRSPLVLYVDNKAMLALCYEQRLEHRTKHIALRYFLARELQQRRQLRLSYVTSRANIADVFTKALGSAPLLPASSPCPARPFCPRAAPAPARPVCRVASAGFAPYYSPRVAPCCSPHVAPCCPARRALLQPACHALLPCTRHPGRAAPPSPSRPHATNAAGAAGSAGGAAGAGDTGGAAGSTGGAGGARPTTDRHCLSWPLSRQLHRLDSPLAPPPRSPLAAASPQHALPFPCLWPSQVPALPPALACPAVPSLRLGAAVLCDAIICIHV
ncbi:unnamed protein product [Closterium sp. NIES-54]